MVAGSEELMKEAYDAVVLGESLIDFIPVNKGEIKNFRTSPGGAPTNVAYGLAQLGSNVALISRVGMDHLGKSMVSSLRRAGVETKYVQYDNERFTTITIVMPDSRDMQRYLIYRGDTADGYVTLEDVPKDLFKYTKIFHCGSLLMSSGVASKTAQQAIEAAKEYGVTVSVDVNLRPNSWSSQREMIHTAVKLVEQSDIVKMTREESETLNINPMDIIKQSDKMVLVTNGGEGAKLYYQGNVVSCKAPSVEVVDETGAGDAFMSAFLHYYLQNDQPMERMELLTKALRLAVDAGAEAVQRQGAIIDI